ncbi:MAG: TIGR03618 family F420-dependent PPOX class oxidoreductase [Gaiellaceae bacterium]
MAETMEAFLARRHVAALGTHNGNGSIQLSAVWYLHEGDNVYIATTAGAVKTRNVRERPNASVLIDSREPGGAMKTASGYGPASVIDGDEAAAINMRIFERYLSAEAIADPNCGGYMIANDDVTLRVTPKRWNWLDLGEAFGGVFETPGYMLPPG